MKKISLLALRVLGASTIALCAHADDGTLQINGDLTDATCSFTAVGGGSLVGSSVVIDMGTVSFGDLQVAASGVDTVRTFKDFAFRVDCTGADQFQRLVMNFDPRSGTGTDTGDNRLLALAPGGASGAALALTTAKGEIIHLTSTQRPTTPLLTTGGVGQFAFFDLGATYLKTTGAQVPGAANASLPFVITYL